MKKDIFQISITFILGFLLSSSVLLLENSTKTETVAKFNGEQYIYPIGDLNVQPPEPPPPPAPDDGN